MTPTLAEQVGQAAGLLGLLLALATLFTSEQARRLAEEGKRLGGKDASVLRFIRISAVLLAVVTFGAIASLTPLALDVLGAIGEPSWEPVLAVFELSYLLLVALLIWQIWLAKSAKSA